MTATSAKAMDEGERLMFKEQSNAGINTHGNSEKTYSEGVEQMQGD